MADIVETTLEKAEALLVKGEMENSEKIFRSVLIIFPENERAIKGLQKIQQLGTAIKPSNLTPPNDKLKEIIGMYKEGLFWEVIQKTEEILIYSEPNILLLNLVSAAHVGLKNFDQAMENYNKILAINPQDAMAYFNIGTIFSENKEFDAAIENYQNCLKVNPNHAEAYDSMGNALKAQGNLTSAIEKFSQAINLKPNFAQAHYNLGVVLLEKGKFLLSIESCEKAVKIKPDYFKAHLTLGNALRQSGELDSAIDSYKQTLKIKPDYADAHFNMGNALKDKGEIDAAIESYKKAIRIKPDYADAYYNMGISLGDQRELDAAIDSYKQALKIKPNHAEAYNNIGIALNYKGELDAAIDSYKQALKITPDYFAAFINLGHAMFAKGELVEAINGYKQALKIRPDDESTYAIKLHLQAHICDWEETESEREKISTLGTLEEGIIPFPFLAIEDVPERHRLRSEIYAKSIHKQNKNSLDLQTSKRSRLLRIGYFSADFNEHPVSFLLASIIESHNRDYFEVYGYSIAQTADDKMRRRLIKGFDFFNDVKDMSDQNIALLAQRDRLDVAVDLTGYSRNGRPGIFACRAAPIQINYLGYPSTMGADFIDYIITDQNVIPNDAQKYYTEKPIYLPHAYMPTGDTKNISSSLLTRAQMGLPENSFVLCCFNNNYKITSAEFNIWMRLLLKIEGSVLWLRKTNKWSETNFLKEAKKRNVDPSRLIFAGKVSMEEHFARHKLADLFIDTFAFNAHTTAIDALWTGLPVVTKLGKGSAARAAGSLLKAIDMPELITNTEEEYEDLILELAENSERLEAIKRRLAANHLSKPLFDTDLYTKHLEDGYQQACQRYFDRKDPEIIYVSA